MALKTGRVRELVSDALRIVPQPYTEDVIDDVFYAIETHPKLLDRYEKECERLRKWVVNNSVGYWTANFMDRVGEREVPARKSSLVGQYSKLDQPAPKRAVKVTEESAAELMSIYYQSHRATLPLWIRECREAILELLLAGVPAETAFEQVVGHGHARGDNK